MKLENNLLFYIFENYLQNIFKGMPDSSQPKTKNPIADKMNPLISTCLINLPKNKSKNGQIQLADH